jgi:hypothetical protein
MLRVEHGGLFVKMCWAGRELIWTARFVFNGLKFGFYASTEYLVSTGYFAYNYSAQVKHKNAAK